MDKCKLNYKRGFLKSTILYSPHVNGVHKEVITNVKDL